MLTGRTPQSVGVLNNVSQFEGEHGMPSDRVSIADLCSIKNLPEGVVGKSFRLSLEQIKAVHKNEVMYWQLNKQWAVRKGDWKLIGNPIDPSPTSKELIFPDDNLAD